jgi:hypothetical protein
MTTRDGSRDDLRSHLPARDFRQELALAMVLADRDRLLRAVVESSLHRWLSDLLVSFAFVADFPDDDDRCATYEVLSFDNTFDQIAIWTEDLDTFRLLFIANTPLAQVREAAGVAASPAFVFAGPETRGRASLIVDDCRSDLGVATPENIARGVEVILSPRPIIGLTYRADTVGGQRLQSIEIAKCCADLGVAPVSLTEADSRLRQKFGGHSAFPSAAV